MREGLRDSVIVEIEVLIRSEELFLASLFYHSVFSLQFFNIQEIYTQDFLTAVFFLCSFPCII